jgi:ribosomal subunit interface protein
MIDSISISGINKYQPDEKLTKYISKKIAKMDKYVPKHHRDSMMAEVKLREQHAKDKKSCHCEVILHVDGSRITAEDNTINMYAAFDIFEDKLLTQLKKAKDNSENGRIKASRQLIRKVFRKYRGESAV